MRRTSWRALVAACGAGVALCAAPRSRVAADEPAPLPPAVDVAREVDGLVDLAWREAKVEPADEAGEAELLRRLSLDVEGVIPDSSTVRAYLGQRVTPERRATVIRGLLHGPGYARSMAARWSNLLVGRQETLQAEQAMGPSVTGWLGAQIAANTPWDVVVQGLIAPEGPAATSGAARYRARFGNALEELTGNAMRTFQGLSVQCAQCHDHPYREEWSQRDFWSLAASFAPDERQVRVPAPPGQQGELVTPRLIDERPLERAQGESRARALGRALTAPGSPLFARATVARVWQAFLGPGLLDPDDVLATPRLPAVLDRLARDFVASGHDLRRLCEVILLTRAYQRTSVGPAATKQAQVALFARAPLRQLSPEQLWASLVRATGLERPLTAAAGSADATAATARRDRARGEFFRIFALAQPGPEGGHDERHTITQALALLNGPLTNGLFVPGADGAPAPLAALLEASPEDALDALYVRILGRLPVRAERAALLRGGTGSAERARLLEDVAWALLNSSEFTTNH